MQRIGVGLGVVFLTGAAIAGALIVHRRTAQSPITVDLTAVRGGSEEPDTDTLNLAVAPIFLPRSTIGDYELLAEYLASRVGRPFRLVQRKTYGEVNELLRRGTVDVAFICAGAYIEARQNNVPLAEVALPVINGRSDYNSLFIVRSASPYRVIHDLENKSFAFTDPLSLSGHLYPHWLLLEEERDPGTFFKRTIFSYSHDASIGAVANGTVDSAAVDSIVYDWEVSVKPELKSSLRVIFTSPPLPFAPIVTPASLPEKVRDLISTALLAMPDSEDGRLVLRKLRIDGFKPPEPGSFDFVISIHDRVGRHLRTR